MDVAKLAKGVSLVGAVGASATVAPPVDVINAVTQLLIAAVGLWEMIRAARKPKGE